MIHQHRLRYSVLLKGSDHTGPDPLVAGPCQPVQSHRKTTVIIDHRQRITVPTPAQYILPFKVHLPQLIRMFPLESTQSRTLAILLSHRPETLQDPVDCPLRDLHSFGLKQGLQLARSPPMGHSLLHHPLFHPAWGAPWTLVRPPGLLPQTSKASHFPIPLYPVMSGRPANPVRLAQLAHCFLLTHRSRYKLDPLIHHFLYLPRHILHLLQEVIYHLRV